MKQTRAFAEAGGDLLVMFQRGMRCPVCDAKLAEVSGDAFAVEIKCPRCNTLTSVRRPMTGPLAQQYGIKPSASRPATLALSTPRGS